MTDLVAVMARGLHQTRSKTHRKTRTEQPCPWCLDLATEQLATPEGKTLAALVEAALDRDGFTDQRQPGDEPMCWECGCTFVHASPAQGGCATDAYREATK